MRAHGAPPSFSFLGQGRTRLCTKGNTDPLAAEIKTFTEFFSEDIVEGDVYDITYQTGVGVVCYKNNKELGTITGMDFKKALIGIWLGKIPADSDLKSGMLGK